MHYNAATGRKIADNSGRAKEKIMADPVDPSIGAAPPPPPQMPPYAYPPPPAPRKNGSSWWKWLLGCGCLALIVFPLILATITAVVAPVFKAEVPFGDKVALIYVSGAITAAPSSGLFGEAGASSERIVRDLRQASEDSSVKAIVLRIDSPGGTAAASQEIYREIIRLRSKDRPIVVSMGDVAASGGYYVASAADEIWANNGTLTGSIGVILQTTDMTGLFGKIGIKPETIKSGKHKDMFSPSRQLTDEERIMAKAMIMDIYNQFVDDVTEGRKHKGLTKQKLLPIADGRVLTGRQAMNAGLVDKIGSLDEAVASAATAAGIQGKPSIWRVRKGFWESLAEARIDIRPQIKIGPEGQAGGADLLLAPEGR